LDKAKSKICPQQIFKKKVFLFWSCGMKIYCKKCHTQLSKDCQIGTILDYDDKAQETAPAVPNGMIIILDEDKFILSYLSNCETPIKKLISTKGAIAINPNDIEDGVLISCGKDNGCCGSDGMDGFNRKCKCGNILGTEWSDCWTQAEIRFEPLKVEIWD